MKWWDTWGFTDSRMLLQESPLVKNTFLAWECSWRVAWVKEPPATRWPVSEWVQHQFGPSLPLSFGFFLRLQLFIHPVTYCTLRLPRNCSQFFSRFWTTCGQTFIFSSQWEHFQASFGFRQDRSRQFFSLFGDTCSPWDFLFYLFFIFFVFLKHNLKRFLPSGFRQG